MNLELLIYETFGLRSTNFKSLNLSFQCFYKTICFKLEMWVKLSIWSISLSNNFKDLSTLYLQNSFINTQRTAFNSLIKTSF